MKQHRIIEIESLRGIAALLVVLFHIPHWNDDLNINFILNGYLMVDLFFVISGFVIYNAYADKIKTKKDLLRFQFLRFARLYPVHLLFLLAYLGVEILKYIAQEKFGIVSPNSQPFRENGLRAFIEHIFLVQSIINPSDSLSFNAPSWSISTEFYTYILFGLIALSFNKIKELLFLSLSLISLYFIAFSIAPNFHDLERCIAGFSIGCLTAWARKKVPFETPVSLSEIAFFALVLFLVFKENQNLDILIYPISSILIFLISDKGRSKFKSLLSHKSLVWLGTISYSLYMCHWIFMWISTQVFRVLLKKPEVLVNGKSSIMLSSTEAFITDVLLLIAVLLMANFTYKTVEKPFRERSRKFADNYSSKRKLVTHAYESEKLEF